MAAPLRTARSTESPMDFEFTSRPTTNQKPVWAGGSADTSTPRKRSVNDMDPPPSPFLQSPHTPFFGRNQNIPFIFNTPAPQSAPPPAWAPPPNFSPIKAFPQPELKDIDMSEVSPGPLKPTSPVKGGDAENDSTQGRAVALGGLRRVFKSRQRMKERKLVATRRIQGDEEGSDVDSDEDDYAAVTQNTSNHYTLNMPGPAPQQSDLPYILLGYLQFFFNLSLILVFLYLLIQFILTVQRDVEHRISEYSMDIVQEIAECAAQYRDNFCSPTPIPAMVKQCGVWETCMNRDPTKVGRAKVGAELIAEVVNGFVEPISWKTLAFTLSSLAFLTLFINSLLSLYRSKLQSSHPQTPIHQAMPAFPLQPSAPYSQHLLTPAPGWGKSWSAVSEVEETPSRRRKLEGGAAKDIK